MQASEDEPARCAARMGARLARPARHTIRLDCDEGRGLSRSRVARVGSGRGTHAATSARCRRRVYEYVRGTFSEMVEGLPKPDASGLQSMLRQVEVDFDHKNLTGGSRAEAERLITKLRAFEVSRI
eukprot:scaffold16844_cov119-Isochrysis_galbana.AAC.4